MIDGPLTALTHGGGQGDLLQMGGFYLLVLSIGQLISYLGNRILLHGSNQVTASLRDQAFQVMQGLPISYFDDKPQTVAPFLQEQHIFHPQRRNDSFR